MATKQQFAVVCKVVISIHTTLAGGDAKNMNTQVTELQISIHTTLAGGDIGYWIILTQTQISIHTTLAGGDNWG